MMVRECAVPLMMELEVSFAGELASSAFVVSRLKEGCVIIREKILIECVCFLCRILYKTQAQVPKRLLKSALFSC